MKDAFASGNAERIVRTYAAHVAPGEFEKASPELKEMLLANVPAFNWTSARADHRLRATTHGGSPCRSWSCPGSEARSGCSA